MSSGQLILCIDDDAIALELRKELLEQNGHIVLAATNTSEALKLFQESPICLVLTDHLLKDRPGNELAWEMKRLKPDVPIVIYSGTVPDTLDNVDCFLLKTEPIPKFLAFIRDVLKRYCE